MEDVRGYVDRDLRAPADVEPRSAPGGFAHRARSASGADLVLGVGDDDLARPAAAGTPTGNLAVRASAIQVTTECRRDPVDAALRRVNASPGRRRRPVFVR